MTTNTPDTQVFNKVYVTSLFNPPSNIGKPRIITYYDNPDNIININQKVEYGCECVGVGNKVSPYADVDYKIPYDTSKSEITRLKEEKDRECVGILESKFSEYNVTIYKSQKETRIIKDNKNKYYKISLRYYVKGVMMKNYNIPKFLNLTKDDNNKPFDTSVYNKGRVLCLPYTHKPKSENDDSETVLYPVAPKGSSKINVFDYCATYVNEDDIDLDILFPDDNSDDTAEAVSEDAKMIVDKVDNNECNDDYKNIDLQELICHFKQERANNYDSWTNGMWAIMNCCDAKGIKQKGTYELCDKFSARCETAYDEDGVYSWFNKNYDRRRECGYRFKFLLDWLKEDDPDYYRKMFVPKKRVLTYEQQKEEFERTDCKIMYPPMIVHKNKDGSFEMLTLKQAKDTYNHIVYQCVEKKKDTEIEVEKKFITKWLDDQDLQLYDKYMFTPPPLKCSDEYFNTWRDFDIFKVPFEQDDIVLQKFNEYRINLLGQEVSDYIVAYFASRLQNPAKRNMVCVIIFGEEGDGKNRFLDIFKNIFGSLYFQELESAKQLFDTHSCFEKEKLFICVNEAKGKDTHENSDKLKARVTTETVTVNPKGIQAFTISNYCDYLMTTNNHNAVNIHDNSRRYLFCESSRCYRQNAEFFKRFSNEIVDNPRALRVIAEYLKLFDVSKIIPSGNFQNHIPKTDIMKTVIEYNRDKLLLFISEYLIKSSVKEMIELSNSFVTSDEMFRWWLNWAENTKSDIKYSKIQFTTKLGLIIKSQNISNIIEPSRNKEGTKRGYKINMSALEQYVRDSLSNS